MATEKLIRPEVGNVIEVDNKVYECHKAEVLCKGCCFIELKFNGTVRCVAPRKLVCDGKIFKQIPRSSVKLEDEPKAEPHKPFLFLLLLTLIVWAAISLVIINL